MDDAEIIGLFFERSEKAITEAEKKYRPYCIAIVRAILSDTRDAEECINDAMLSLWKSIPPEKPKKLSVYLGSIVRNLALNRLKESNAYKRKGDKNALAYEELSEFLEDSKSVEKEIEFEELERIVKSFVSELPKEERLIFVGRFWYNNTAGEIAGKIGCSESKVKKKLKKIRDALADRLREEGYYE